MDELVQLCRAKDMAICVPHANGIPVRTAGIFEERKKKGVCLVLDETLVSAAEGSPATATSENLHKSRGSSPVALDCPQRATSNEFKAKAFVFKPDISLSLGDDVAPEGSMQFLHPITVASLLLYHAKQAHFPNVRGSPHIFSIKQKL